MKCDYKYNFHLIMATTCGNYQINPLKLRQTNSKFIKTWLRTQFLGYTSSKIWKMNKTRDNLTNRCNLLSYPSASKQVKNHYETN